MNKKLLYGITGAACIILIGLILWYFGLNFEISEDAKNFKTSYESYNGQKNETGESYIHVSIPKDNKVEYVDVDDAIKKMSSGDALLYLGSPTDNVNRKYVETIINAVDASKIEKLYYLEISSGSADYEKISDEIDDELTLPILFAIKSGKIEDSLKLEDQEEIKDDVNELISVVLTNPNVCDETC